MSKVILAFLVIATTVSGCGGDPKAIGPFPSSYEQLVRDQIRQSFFDPYSVRDARLTYPEPGQLYFQSGWIVCLEANAKNRMGAYVGRKRTAYLINNNSIVNSMTDAPLCDSAKLSYQPLAISS